MISLNRNYQEVINLLFALPFGLYLNVLKTEKILQFWDKDKYGLIKRKKIAQKELLTSCAGNWFADHNE